MTVEEHRDPACVEHPHCPFCGGVMVADRGRVVCVGCGTDAPVVEPAVVSR